MKDEIAELKRSYDVIFKRMDEALDEQRREIKLDFLTFLEKIQGVLKHDEKSSMLLDEKIKEYKQDVGKRK